MNIPLTLLTGAALSGEDLNSGTSVPENLQGTWRGHFVKVPKAM